VLGVDFRALILQLFLIFLQGFQIGLPVPPEVVLDIIPEHPILLIAIQRDLGSDQEVGVHRAPSAGARFPAARRREPPSILTRRAFLGKTTLVIALIICLGRDSRSSTTT